ncbi:unnamed protein product [marine sediment metagenome]|uniref:Uncharacterized protein n=1 Tax=marine sediment metagenome TaxID=412755 RepID=X1VJG4_9ZZZZ
MPLPKEQLKLISEDIEAAEKTLADMKDVIDDMRLAGMSIDKQQKTYDDLTDRLRSLKVFYARQEAKSG